MKYSEGYTVPGGVKVKVRAWRDDVPTYLLSWKPVVGFLGGTEIELTEKELARYERYRREQDFWDDLIWSRCAEVFRARQSA
jgi:hypothetical protein